MMKYMMRIAIAAVALAGAVAPALAFPPGEGAITNVPWGTTDSNPAYLGGGDGGPDMRITPEAHRDWPNFHARVEGSTNAVANRDLRGGNAPTVR